MNGINDIEDQRRYTAPEHLTVVEPLLSPYEFGVAAREGCYSITDNPYYEKQEEAHAEWQRGWMDANESE